MSEQKCVYIISDSTGETAYHVLQTVLAQFDSDHVRVQRFADVTSPQQIHDVVEEAARTEGLIFHTLVSPGLREAVTYLSANRGILCVDVLGMPIERLSAWLRPTEPTVSVGTPVSFFDHPARFSGEPVCGNSGSQKRRVEQ